MSTTSNRQRTATGRTSALFAVALLASACCAGAHGHGHGHSQHHSQGHGATPHHQATPPRHGAPHHGGAAQRGVPLHHRFDDAERWAKRFESPERAKWQKPDAVVKALKIGAGATVADIGSGTGYFAVRFARAVGPSGHVYAIDVEPSMVRYLRQRATREALPNLDSRLGATTDPLLPRPADLIFICNTYHHIAARTDYFQRLAESLTPDGRLVIVDFKMGKIPVGPPERHRVAPDQLDDELKAAGYRRAALDVDTLPYQYIATYARSR